MSTAPSSVPATESSADRAAALRLVVVRVAVHFVAAVVYCLVAVLLVSAVQELFDDFEIELPAATQGVLYFSELLGKFWILLFVAVALVDAPLLFALQMMTPSRQWVARYWFWGVLAAAGLSIVWIVFAMLLPVIGVLEKLQ